jgi:hypothetical protein
MAHGGAFPLVSVPVDLLVIFFFQRWRLLAALIEEINNLRGGPLTPVHPYPADDGALLRRRPRRIEN